LNIADEYINEVQKFGHWKDSLVKLEGNAAWSFTLMFLQMWKICNGKDEDYEQYYPWTEQKCEKSNDGYVLPYCDSPMDSENVGEHVYLQIINSAKKYLYIATPYLIIDDSMVSALALAAKSGVDVRIITPNRWDKWLVHMTTRSYYRELIKAGVKIYEYSKGFIHSKLFVSDDRVATVGTTNLDFRSLYLHFECGSLFYGGKTVEQVKSDFDSMLPICKKITLKDCTAGLITKMFQDILRVFAPFM
jgi:cardiolipin synthase